METRASNMATPGLRRKPVARVTTRVISIGPASIHAVPVRIPMRRLYCSEYLHGCTPDVRVQFRVSNRS